MSIKKYSRSKNINHHGNDHQNLFNLIKKITQASKYRNKSKNNLPAHLMKLNLSSTNTNKGPKVYSKSVSSTYSSMMHNGHEHSKGKKIVNESTNPFIKIDEMEDGSVQQYVVPRNEIAMSSMQPFMQSPMDMQIPIELPPMQMSMHSMKMPMMHMQIQQHVPMHMQKMNKKTSRSKKISTSKKMSNPKIHKKTSMTKKMSRSKKISKPKVHKKTSRSKKSKAHKKNKMHKKSSRTKKSKSIFNYFK